VLMDLQQQQLNQLSDFLNQMEARISSHSPVGGSEQQVTQQLETHQVCTQLALISSDRHHVSTDLLTYCKLYYTYIG